MPELVPVDHDPFDGKGPTLEPVDHDPTFSTAVSGSDPRIALPQQTSEGLPYYQVTNQLAPQTEDPFAWRKNFIRDQRERDRLIAYIDAEVGAQGPKAQQAFAESAVNGAFSRGQTLTDRLWSNYYPPETHYRAARRVTDDMRAKYGPIIDKVEGGSNISNYATGNASGDVGFNGGPRTASYGDENFGVEGPDAEWARQAGYDGPLPAQRDVGGLSRSAGPTVTSTMAPGDIPPPAVNRAGETFPTYALKQIAGGLINQLATPGRAYKQGLTPEEEVNWASGTALNMAGTRTPFAGAGEAGIFGGRLSKTANLDMLNKAEQMHAAGAPRESIWNQTGWFRGADGKWRYEIPDQRAAVQPMDRIYSATSDAASKPAEMRYGPLGEAISHPEAFAAYPQLKDMPSVLDIHPGANRRGGYTPAAEPFPRGQIEARAGTMEDARSVLLHEMQHGVQDIEGFATGGSPRNIPLTERELSDITKTALRRTEGMKPWSRMNAGEKNTALTAARHRAYEMLAGEVEPRNVQTRSDFENRQVPPWKTEDVPRASQIVRSNEEIGTTARRPAQAFEPVEHDPFAFQEHPGIISTRYPTGKTSLENPLTQRLTIDTDAMRKDPEKFKQNVGLVRDLPLLTKEEARGKPDEVAARFIDKVKDNLLWLHDQVPPEIRNRSKLWYDGANRIVNERAKQYELPPASVSGVYAAMSPQKDWFQNVSLGDRVLDTYFNQGDFRFSAAMQRQAQQSFGDPKYSGLLKLVQDRTLNELKTPGEKAMWIRLYDEAHRPSSYPVVTPEGGTGLTVTNKDGRPSKVAWGSLAEIAKAVGAIEAKGDASALSALMGERHKVRNFYNNMLHPNAPYGDVTVDTHAVAAGLLRPLSGNATEVSHNFANYAGKGIPRAASSAVSGASGLYGLYADAYRQAAAERGILPREMQSITWEAVRGLFPDVFKAQQKNVGAIDKMWHNYRAGKATLNETRKQVHDYAGGIEPPAWYRE